MRAKLLTLMSATGLGLLTLVGFQSAAQAHEGYRHGYSRYFHGGQRDYGGYSHFRHYRRY